MHADASLAALARSLAILARSLRPVLEHGTLRALTAPERASLGALRCLLRAELSVVDDYVDLSILPLPYDEGEEGLEALETAVRAANAVLFGCMVLDLRRAHDAAGPAWARLQSGVEEFFRLIVPTADPLDPNLYRCLFDAEVYRLALAADHNFSQADGLTTPFARIPPDRRTPAILATKTRFGDETSSTIQENWPSEQVERTHLFEPTALALLRQVSIHSAAAFGADDASDDILAHYADDATIDLWSPKRPVYELSTAMLRQLTAATNAELKQVLLQAGISTLTSPSAPRPAGKGKERAQPELVIEPLDLAPVPTAAKPSQRWMQPGVRGEQIAFDSQSQGSIHSSPHPIAGPSKRRAVSPAPAPPRKKAKATTPAPTGKRRRLAWSEAEEALLLEELARFHQRTDCWDTILRRHGAQGTKTQTLKLRDGHALKDKTRNLRTALERKGKAVPVYLTRVASVKGS